MAASESTVEPELLQQLLPAAAFTDPAVLAAEARVIFDTSWVNIGPASGIPAAGDVRTLEVLGRSVVLVRDHDGRVRVFDNVCRHRGHSLVQQQNCRVPALTCPYHGWTFSLAGAFRGAPCWGGVEGAAPPKEIKADLALREIRSAVWCDTVFINRSGTAAPFDDFIAPLARRWAPYALECFYLAENREYAAPGNWKLAIENFLDTYHFPLVHKEFGNYAVMLRNTPVRVGDDVFGYHMPTGEADKPKTGAPLPQLDLPDVLRPAQDILYLYPNTLLILTSSWLQVINLLPTAPGETLEQLSIYLVRDEGASAAVEATRADFIKAANFINQQDMPVLGNLQVGMRTGADDLRYVRYWDDNPRHLHERLLHALDYGRVAGTS